MSPPVARDSGEDLEIISEKMSKSKKNGVNPQVGSQVCFHFILVLGELMHISLYVG